MTIIFNSSTTQSRNFGIGSATIHPSLQKGWDKGEVPQYAGGGWHMSAVRATAFGGTGKP